MTDGKLTVTVFGAARTLGPGEEFTFGRGTDCTACLDPADTGISRLAGSLEHGAGVWWLTNRSARRQLVVVNHLGLRNVLAPGLRVPVEGTVRVLVEGSAGSHFLDLAGPPSRPAEPAEQHGLTTAIGQEVSITLEDRAALVALFAGYLLDGDRYDPVPRTYQAAAACRARPWSSGSSTCAAGCRTPAYQA
jgi:hypothetical protein